MKVSNPSIEGMEEKWVNGVFLEDSLLFPSIDESFYGEQVASVAEQSAKSALNLYNSYDDMSAILQNDRKNEFQMSVMSFDSEFLKEFQNPQPNADNKDYDKYEHLLKKLQDNPPQKVSVAESDNYFLNMINPFGSGDDKKENMSTSIGQLIDPIDQIVKAQDTAFGPAAFANLKHQYNFAIETIRDLQLRLVRRTQSIEHIRKHYLKDIIVVKQVLEIIEDYYNSSSGSGSSSSNTAFAKSSSSYNPPSNESIFLTMKSIPSLDFRTLLDQKQIDLKLKSLNKQTLPIYAPKECELRVKPCGFCGGQLELVKVDRDEIVFLKKTMLEIQEREKLLKNKLTIKEAQNENLTTNYSTLSKKYQEEKEILLEELKKLRSSNESLEEKIESTKELNKKIKANLLTIDQLTEENTSYKANYDKLVKDYDILLINYNDTQEKVKILKANEKNLNNNTTSNKALHELQAKYDDLQNKLDKLTLESENTRKLLSNTRERCQELQYQVDNQAKLEENAIEVRLKVVNNEHESKIKALTAEFQEKMDKLLKEKEEAEKKINAREQLIENISQELLISQESIKTIENETAIILDSYIKTFMAEDESDNESESIHNDEDISRQLTGRPIDLEEKVKEDLNVENLDPDSALAKVIVNLREGRIRRSVLLKEEGGADGLISGSSSRRTSVRLKKKSFQEIINNMEGADQNFSSVSSSLTSSPFALRNRKKLSFTTSEFIDPKPSLSQIINKISQDPAFKEENFPKIQNNDIINIENITTLEPENVSNNIINQSFTETNQLNLSSKSNSSSEIHNNEQTMINNNIEQAQIDYSSLKENKLPKVIQKNQSVTVTKSISNESMSNLSSQRNGSKDILVGESKDKDPEIGKAEEEEFEKSFDSLSLSNDSSEKSSPLCSNNLEISVSVDSVENSVGTDKKSTLPSKLSNLSELSKDLKFPEGASNSTFSDTNDITSLSQDLFPSEPTVEIDPSILFLDPTLIDNFQSVVDTSVKRKAAIINTRGRLEDIKKFLKEKPIKKKSSSKRRIQNKNAISLQKMKEKEIENLDIISSDPREIKIACDELWKDMQLAEEEIRDVREVLKQVEDEEILIDNKIREEMSLVDGDESLNTVEDDDPDELIETWEDVDDDYEGETEEIEIIDPVTNEKITKKRKKVMKRRGSLDSTSTVSSKGDSIKLSKVVSQALIKKKIEAKENTKLSINLLRRSLNNANVSRKNAVQLANKLKLYLSKQKEIQAANETEMNEEDLEVLLKKLMEMFDIDNSFEKRNSVDESNHSSNSEEKKSNEIAGGETEVETVETLKKKLLEKDQLIQTTTNLSSENAEKFRSLERKNQGFALLEKDYQDLTVKYKVSERKAAQLESKLNKAFETNKSLKSELESCQAKILEQIQEIAELKLSLNETTSKAEIFESDFVQLKEQVQAAIENKVSVSLQAGLSMAEEKELERLRELQKGIPPVSVETQTDFISGPLDLRTVVSRGSRNSREEIRSRFPMVFPHPVEIITDTGSIAASESNANIPNKVHSDIPLNPIESPFLFRPTSSSNYTLNEVDGFISIPLQKPEKSEEKKSTSSSNSPSNKSKNSPPKFNFNGVYDSDDQKNLIENMKLKGLRASISEELKKNIEPSDFINIFTPPNNINHTPIKNNNLWSSKKKSANQDNSHNNVVNGIVYNNSNSNMTNIHLASRDRTPPSNINISMGLKINAGNNYGNKHSSPLNPNLLSKSVGSLESLDQNSLLSSSSQASLSQVKGSKKNSKSSAALSSAGLSTFDKNSLKKLQKELMSR